MLECVSLASDDSEAVSIPVADAQLTRRFGDPIYPALIPVDSVRRDSEKPAHILIEADNYHALQLLTYTHEGKVDVIYIDPPYNTGARDWKYNNNYVDNNDRYRHSKWLSSMKRRLFLAKKLLKPDGVLIITIDDNELNGLGLLLAEIFPERLIQLITVVINPGGTYKINFARVHEYAYFVCPADIETISGIPVTGEESKQLFEEEGGEKFEIWKLRRTGSESAHRHQRRNQFYAIHVDKRSLKVTGIGPEIGKDEKYPKEDVDNCYRIYPIDGKGAERVWRYGQDTMSEKISKGLVFAKRQRDAVSLYFKAPPKVTKRIKSVWWEPTHSSVGTASTVLVDNLLGRPGAFPFPKSLYLVKDCLRAASADRENALILDFFGGSGTTLHATALLNAEDDGRRQCILITNNEVGETKAKQLRRNDILPGSHGWDAEGICRSVTWPRCKAAIEGKRPDGSDVSGNYLSGRELKQGFEENLHFLSLQFLDPNSVALGEEFEAILPILWMKAGAVGNLELRRGSTPWLIPKESPFAILIRESKSAEFFNLVAKREDIRTVFLITDSEESFREMQTQLGAQYQCFMLYKSYLQNFRINTPDRG